jgi:membrane protein
LIADAVLIADATAITEVMALKTTRRSGFAGWFSDARLVLRDAVVEARHDRLTTTAQALAYSLFLAIPSAFLVVLGVFSLVASPGDVNNLIQRAQTVIPAEAATLLSDSLRRSTESPNSGLIVTITGAALALWATTSAATTLMRGITTAFDQPDSRGFVRKRLVALVIVVCLVAAAALVSGLLVLGPYLQRWVGDSVGHPSLIAWAWWTAQWPILIVGLLLAFAVLLYLGPDVDQRRWKLITPGAITAMVIWLAASAAFALYAARFGSYNKTWGTLSAVVVMLIWLWLTSAALLFGAEVNSQTQRLLSQRSERCSRAEDASPTVARVVECRDDRDAPT